MGSKSEQGNYWQKISELASGVKQGSCNSFDIFVQGFLRNVFKNYFNYEHICMCLCMGVGM